MTDVAIRPHFPGDDAALWRILEPVFRAGETYAIDSDISRDDALAYWCGPERRVFSALVDGVVAGSYYIVRNQKGGGSHVCNCGFATDPGQTGKGVARAMLAHALDTARSLGFRAMQFNFVVSSNSRAVAIWERAGFEIVGRLPDAFRHPEKGYVDALVMYKALETD